MHLYTAADMPPAPAPEHLNPVGCVVLRRRTDFYAKATFVVTYENAVGGMVSYRFRLRRDAVDYCRVVEAVRHDVRKAA